MSFFNWLSDDKFESDRSIASLVDEYILNSQES